MQKLEEKISNITKKIAKTTTIIASAAIVASCTPKEVQIDKKDINNDGLTDIIIKTTYQGNKKTTAKYFDFYNNSKIDSTHIEIKDKNEYTIAALDENDKLVRQNSEVYHKNGQVKIRVQLEREKIKEYSFKGEDIKKYEFKRSVQIYDKEGNLIERKEGITTNREVDGESMSGKEIKNPKKVASDYTGKTTSYENDKIVREFIFNDKVIGYEYNEEGLISKIHEEGFVENNEKTIIFEYENGELVKEYQKITDDENGTDFIGKNPEEFGEERIIIYKDGQVKTEQVKTYSYKKLVSDITYDNNGKVIATNLEDVVKN